MDYVRAIAGKSAVLGQTSDRRDAFLPLVACGEFYAIRLTGIPFGTTAVILAIVNLPAIYLIWKHRVRIASLERSDWFVGASAVVIPIACLLPVLIYMDARIYSPHGWYHADAVYMFAQGAISFWRIPHWRA